MSERASSAIMLRGFLLIGLGWLTLIAGGVAWLIAGYDVLGLIEWGGVGTAAVFPAGLGLALIWSCHSGGEATP